MILWNGWFRTLLALPVILCPGMRVSGQDLEAALELAYQGKLEAAGRILPALKSQSGDRGALLFLEGLISPDGDAAVALFRKTVQLYPNSDYADDALMKIGEYLYARGLYVQAAEQLRRIPVYYPRSDLAPRSIRLFLNSLLVAGNRDTAAFYAQVFARRYPHMEFDLRDGRVLRPPGQGSAGTGEIADVDAQAGPKSAGLPGAAAARSAGAEPATGVYRIQVGAFRNVGNADTRKQLLKSLNYQAEIVPIQTGDRPLYAVMIMGFATRSSARAAGEQLKADHGLDYLVLSQR